MRGRVGGCHSWIRPTQNPYEALITLDRHILGSKGVVINYGEEGEQEDEKLMPRRSE